MFQHAETFAPSNLSEICFEHRRFDGRTLQIYVPRGQEKTMKFPTLKLARKNFGCRHARSNANAT